MTINIDRALEEAVKEIVKEKGQPEITSNRIIAWLKELSIGNQAVDDELKFLESTLGTLIVKDNSGED